MLIFGLLNLSQIKFVTAREGEKAAKTGAAKWRPPAASSDFNFSQASGGGGGAGAKARSRGVLPAGVWRANIQRASRVCLRNNCELWTLQPPLSQAGGSISYGTLSMAARAERPPSMELAGAHCGRFIGRPKQPFRRPKRAESLAASAQSLHRSKPAGLGKTDQRASRSITTSKLD